MKVNLQRQSNLVLQFFPFVLPLILFVVLVGLLSLDSSLQLLIASMKTRPAPLSFAGPAFFPQLASTKGEATGFFAPIVSPTPEALSPDAAISAASAIVMDDASHVILYAKNERIRLSTASVAKVMTALVALDHFSPTDILTVYDESMAQAKVGFRVGDRVYFRDMLYGMLLPSGNDAAVAIAQNYPGGESAFIDKMNAKAAVLHLDQTHFADSAGLVDTGDYSSALDLARLASYAMQQSAFREIVGTKYATITTLSGAVYKLSNINKLLGSDGFDGIKTGFTDEAGEVLVTSKEIDAHRLITVVMKSQDRFSDTLFLTSYVGDKLSYVDFTKAMPSY